MDKKIKGVKIKRLFCHIHLTWKLTRERKEIILLKGQENRGFKIPAGGFGGFGFTTPQLGHPLALLLFIAMPDFAPFKPSFEENKIVGPGGFEPPTDGL